MKSFLQNVLLRSVCVLAFGVILLVFSSEVTRWIVYVSGGLFVILGAIVLIGSFRKSKDSSAEKRSTLIYPMVAIGSVMFGLVQLVFPDLFFGVLRYLLAGILCLFALVQFYSLIVIRKNGVAVGWGYFLLPILGVVAGAVVMLYDGFATNDAKMMMLLGAVFILYALLELWTIVLVKRSSGGFDNKEELKKIER